MTGFARSTRTFDTRKEASKWAKDHTEALKSSRKGSPVRREITQFTIADLIKEYLDDPTNKQLSSYKDVDDRLSYFVNKYATERLMEFGIIQLREARTDLSRGRKGSTVNRYLSCLRSCWHWGQANQMIQPNHGFPRRLLLPEPEGRERFLSDHERVELLKAAKADPLIYNGIMIALSTGLRRGELLALDWKDVDLTAKDPAVMVMQSKNGKARAVPLTDAAVSAFKRLRSLPVVSPTAIFLTKTGKRIDQFAFGKRFRPIFKAAGLVDFKWHDLRHSAGSFLHQHGATEMQIAEVLGHSDPRMAARYSHLKRGMKIPGMKELSDLIE